MQGYFDALSVPDGWFSPMLQSIAWFDEDLIALAAEEEDDGDPPGPRPLEILAPTIRGLSPRTLTPRSP